MWQRELIFYLKTAVIGLLVFGLCYGYLKWSATPSELNKAAADTAILLMGFSMWQSSLSYFFNSMDRAIIYRKYFGLVGFAFAVTHLILSWSAFLRLFSLQLWLKGEMLPLLTGLLALVIFTIMALISNSFLTRIMGSEAWRRTLRTGYLAVIFVLVHVVLLKSARWITWWEGGMKTPPALSLIVALCIVVVLISRAALWWSLKRNRALQPQSAV